MNWHLYLELGLPNEYVIEHQTTEGTIPKSCKDQKNDFLCCKFFHVASFFDFLRVL
jgi:hypothetical protein